MRGAATAQHKKPALWLSTTGLILCGFYASLSLACLVLAPLHTGDGVGAYILLRLPLEPAIFLLASLGLDDLVKGMSWALGYILLLPPTLAMIYACGWVIGWLCSLVSPSKAS